MGRRVLICGGRDFRDADYAFRVLDAVASTQGSINLVMHGAARGADRIGGEWAKFRKIPVITYPADWERHGKRAGPIRNTKMLKDGEPDLVIAFPGGRGTAHMVSIAKKAGVEVVEVDART